MALRPGESLKRSVLAGGALPAHGAPPARATHASHERAHPSRPTGRARVLPCRSLLQGMQTLLARLYDAPVGYDVQDFLLDAPHAPRAERSSESSADLQSGDARQAGGSEGAAADEQVYLLEDEQGVRIGVYIDPQVLERLSRRDPLRALDEDNLADYCTALEGVSHFHYLTWSLTLGRSVSLLELELQAEVDKYASALALLTRQGGGRYPQTLHGRMFESVSFLPQLDEVSRKRYEEANRHAARYCHRLDERYLRARRLRPDRWVAELRHFFRCGHHEKIRQLALA